MIVQPERINTILSGVGRSTVLVLGDIMLDEYWFGAVNRISPEAPVPVVEISSIRLLLGGAANVAANIRSLGDSVILLGLVGEDEASIKLSQLLKEKEIAADALLQDSSRSTTIKTRIIAHSQQVVRADRENTHEMDADTELRVLKRFEHLLPRIKAVVISDYGKGVITRSLLEKLIPLCRANNVFVAVDPKETHFLNYRQVSVITPNHHEAGFAWGRRINTEADLLEVGNGLLEKLQVESILITRGAKGMSLFQRNAKPTHIPTFAKKVFDVTGAGDTVIASFVAAVCAGANLVEASVLANTAAGFTVGEIGTATITLPQLRQEIERNLTDGTLTEAMASKSK